MAHNILKKMRGLPRKLSGGYHRKKREKEFLRRVAAPGSRCAVIIGSPIYGNYGDSAILLAQAAFLRSALPSGYSVEEISYSEFYRYRNQLRTALNPHCLIACMGGGNMGNQWAREEQIRYDILADYPQNPVIVFPQTLYFSKQGDPAYTEERSAAVYAAAGHLTLAAREQRSLEEMRRLYPGTEIVFAPDIVLWAGIDSFGVRPQTRSGILVCRRTDSERAVSDDAWDRLIHAASASEKAVRSVEMDVDGAITKQNRAQQVRQKMQEFCGAELVITDRLHGMVFAALTGTPCVVLSNYNHKVRGTYEWIKFLPYIRYADSAEEAISLIPALLSMKECSYDNTPLLPYYEALKEVVRQKCLKSV